MQTFGAKVLSSPSDTTDFGRKVLKEMPDTTGSLGIATHRSHRSRREERRLDQVQSGSVLNHVLLHQTIIGEEAKLQMESVGEYPDVVIGCVGGGSNYAGISFPLRARQAEERQEDRLHRGRTDGLPHDDAWAIRI
jgi:tryptophan synthase beta chain